MVDEESRGWGIVSFCVPGVGNRLPSEKKKMQIPGGRPGKGGMVTGRIEPCIILSDKQN